MDRSTSEPSSQLQDISCALVLFLLCLFGLFGNLGAAALFEPDEGRNAEVAREILLLGDWATPHNNFVPRLDKPVFFYWLVALAHHFFGISEWSARLPSAVAALGCILLTLRLARSSFGSQTAWWSGLVLLSSVEFLLLARITISDMTLAFFVTLSLSAFYWGTRAARPRSRRVLNLLMYASLGCGTLIKGPVGLVLPGIVIFFYLLLARRWAVVRYMDVHLGLALFLILVVPLYGWVELRNPGYLRYFGLEEHLFRYLTRHFDENQPWYYFFGVLTVGFLPWTLLIPAIVKDLWRRAPDDNNLFLILWTVLPFLFFSFSQAKMAEYILPMYPSLAILAGRTLGHIVREPSDRGGWVLALPWLPIISWVLYIIVGLFWPSLLPQPLRRSFDRVSPSISPWIPIILLFSAVTLAFAGRMRLQARQTYLYVSYGAAFFLFFLLIQQVTEAESRNRSSRELAEKSAAFIQVEDQIVIYNTYLSSLPFYLRIDQPIWIVWSGSKRSIMGSYYVTRKRPKPAQGYGQVLFTFEEFSKQWTESKRKLLVFLKEKNLPTLAREVGVMPKQLLKVDGIVLVTNK